MAGTERVVAGAAAVTARMALSVALGAVFAAPAVAQTSPRPSGRLSAHVNTVTRRPEGGGRSSSETELSTAVEFESAEAEDSSGLDYRLDLRRSQTTGALRPSRVSIYDAYVGAHIGEGVQVRLRAGHMWLSELGTVGSLAGGLVEVGQARAATGVRFRAGAFAGREPNPLTTGYADGVTKLGGYAALESGFLRRHLVGYTRVTQGGMTERSVVSVTNFVPAGSRFFLYQAAEYDVKGPAQGAGRSGLSYFLANARLNPAERVELSATYNRGRSIDARTLTSDLLNGRPLTPQATEGLRYESTGGRVTVEVVRNVRLYVAYAQDRTNRDDARTGRVTWGGYASNVLRTGVDVSGSDALVDRPTGPYHSRYISIGRSLGRAVYVSGDYSTSLSVVQFLRSDGLLIETRPWTRRYSGSANVTMSRSLFLLVTADYTLDEAERDVRLLSGLTYRIR
jgi:hypothetical protein